MVMVLGRQAAGRLWAGLRRVVAARSATAAASSATAAAA